MCLTHSQTLLFTHILLSVWTNAEVEAVAQLILTLVLRPHCGLQAIGWRRMVEGIWECERARESSVKLFVERRLLAFHSCCTLYLLYLFSCNTRHRVEPQRAACSDHVFHNRNTVCEPIGDFSHVSSTDRPSFCCVLSSSPQREDYKIKSHSSLCQNNFI